MKLIGSLRYKVDIRGDILSTGIEWEASAERLGGEASLDTAPSGSTRDEGLPEGLPHPE